MTLQIHGESYVATPPSGTNLYSRWKGKLEGKEGSFPANFVEVV